jgi:hypothetical protein
MASESLTAVKGIAAKLSVTAWLFLGGFILVVMSFFFSWATNRITDYGDNITRHFGVTADGIFILLLMIAVAAWLAWPILSGSAMPVWRLAGLSGVAGLFLLGIFVAIYGGFDLGGSRFGTSTPGFGVLLYTAGTVAIAAGVVRTWMHRSQTQKRAS